MKALCLTPCWPSSMVGGAWQSATLAPDAQKDIENRIDWKGSNFRGDLLIHAAKGMTTQRYAECVSFAEKRGLSWRPPMFDDCPRGGIVGLVKVIDVIMPGGFMHPLALPRENLPRDALTIKASATSAVRHPKAHSRWYMGGFALVLVDRVPLPFLKTTGKLGLFAIDDAWLLKELLARDVPERVLRRVQEAAR